MKLPSGYEISREKLLEVFEAVVAEKFAMECTFADAFKPVAESLREGEYTDIPALTLEDVSFLGTELVSVVIICEGELRSTLGRFEAESTTISSW